MSVSRKSRKMGLPAELRAELLEWAPRKQCAVLLTSAGCLYHLLQKCNNVRLWRCEEHQKTHIHKFIDAISALLPYEHVDEQPIIGRVDYEGFPGIKTRDIPVRLDGHGCVSEEVHFALPGAKSKDFRPPRKETGIIRYCTRVKNEEERLHFAILICNGTPTETVKKDRIKSALAEWEKQFNCQLSLFPFPEVCGGHIQVSIGIQQVLAGSVHGLLKEVAKVLNE